MVRFVSFTMMDVQRKGEKKKIGFSMKSKKFRPLASRARDHIELGGTAPAEESLGKTV